MQPTWSEPALVRVDDVTLCVQTVGDVDDPPLLLIGGAAASMDWWDDAFCERLAAGGRLVHRYDHRDTGASTTFAPGSPPYDAGRLATDALGLLDALGLPAVHVVGVSMGGGIAQQIAVRHPERVLSLALLSTTAAGGVERSLPGPAERVQQSFADPLPDPDWRDVDAFAEWMLAGERTFAGRIPVDPERVREIASRAWHRSSDPASAGNHWLAVGGDDDEPPPDVTTIRAPTLVVHGDADPLFPLPHGEALAEAVPGARLLVVPDLGHQVPPPETWDLVVPALLHHTSGGWDVTGDRLARRAVAAARPTAWFEDLYAAARRGEVPMPWDRSAPHTILAPWLASAPDGAGRTAVVVGCGLGADAEAVAAHGFRTTAFDIADSAVREARSRRPSSPVDYVTADLFDLPRDWRRHFDLVVEIITVQAMPLSLREAAVAAVRDLVAPGGTLLVGTSVRASDELLPEGPPWPLSTDELDLFAGDGLVERSREVLPGPGVPRYRLLLERVPSEAQ